MSAIVDAIKIYMYENDPMAIEALTELAQLKEQIAKLYEYIAHKPGCATENFRRCNCGYEQLVNARRVRASDAHGKRGKG